MKGKEYEIVERSSGYWITEGEGNPDGPYDSIEDAQDNVPEGQLQYPLPMGNKKEEKLPHGVSSESMARWKNMDRSQIHLGLRELKDWLKYNTESAWRNEHRLLSDHDHTYYEKVLENAATELED